MPETKTFIDSRTDIFEYRGVLKDYLAGISGDKTYEVLDKYQICYAVLPKAAPVSYFLGKSPGWKSMYSDEVSIILGRADCQKPVGRLDDPGSNQSTRIRSEAWHRPRPTDYLSFVLEDQKLVHFSN